MSPKSRTATLILLLILAITLPVAASAGEDAPAGLAVASEGSARSLSLDGGAPFHRTANPVSGERLVEVAGSPVRLVLWNETLPDGSLQAHYAIGLDGNNMATVRPTSYEMQLRYAKFDPEAGAPPGRPRAGRQSRIEPAPRAVRHPAAGGVPRGDSRTGRHGAQVRRQPRATT